MELNKITQTVKDYSKKFLYEPFKNNAMLKVGLSGFLLGVGIMLYGGLEYIRHPYPQLSERLKNFYQANSQLDSLNKKVDLGLLLNAKDYRDSISVVFQDIKSRKDSLENLMGLKEEMGDFESKVNKYKESNNNADGYVIIGAFLGFISASPLASGIARRKYRREKLF